MSLHCGLIDRRTASLYWENMSQWWPCIWPATFRRQETARLSLVGQVICLALSFWNSEVHLTRECLSWRKRFCVELNAFVRWFNSLHCVNVYPVLHISPYHCLTVQSCRADGYCLTKSGNREAYCFKEWLAMVSILCFSPSGPGFLVFCIGWWEWLQ